MSLANIASNFVYYNLSINIGNMAGDIFWNFFMLAIVEGPSNFLAIWLAVLILNVKYKGMLLIIKLV